MAGSGSIDETERGAGGFGHTGKKMKRILLFSLLSTLLFTSCMAVQSGGECSRRCGYGVGVCSLCANAVTKKVKKRRIKKKKFRRKLLFGFSINRSNSVSRLFFLESHADERKRKSMTAAFGLLEHCLDIHGNASSRLRNIPVLYVSPSSAAVGRQPWKGCDLSAL